ncbi:MAG: hypothetical protein DDT26_01604 [Dehalococcoidia bacterium]|nr:hypothetical protein [Chloroflexota bacterium]
MLSEPPIVVLLPHPDDEFAILPFLEDESRRGRTLHLAWITNGGYAGMDPAIRRDESLSALRLCGVNPASLHFIGMENQLPDGSLHLHMPRAFEALKSALGDMPTSFELWLPAWEGGHQDHDAVHALGRSWARSYDTLALEYPLYNGAGLRGPLFRTLMSLPGKSAQKCRRFDLRALTKVIRTCFCYRSQWRSFVGLLPMVIAHCVFGGRLTLSKVDLAAPMTKPHDGLLLYERRTSIRWADFGRAVKDYW